MLNSNIENFKKKYYDNCEKIVLQYKEFINNKDILDIGSNIGLFSKAIVKNLNYKSIHMFEPSYEYSNYSKKYLHDNKNIFINNYGLGSENNKLCLYKSKNENIGWNTFLTDDPNQKQGFIDNMEKEFCIVKKLDDYNIDNIDFIKIDVEGFEDQVILGGLNSIKKYKPYILVEVGWGTNHPHWEVVEKTYKKLFDIGYKKIEFKNFTQDILFEPL